LKGSPDRQRRAVAREGASQPPACEVSNPLPGRSGQADLVARDSPASPGQRLGGPGPPCTEPSMMEYMLPWHGHLDALAHDLGDLAAPRGCRCWRNPLKLPRDRLGDHGPLLSEKILPPPTGMSEVVREPRWRQPPPLDPAGTWSRPGSGGRRPPTRLPVGRRPSCCHRHAGRAAGARSRRRRARAGQGPPGRWAPGAWCGRFTVFLSRRSGVVCAVVELDT